MYRNVYFHKVVRSAEGMVRLALQRAARLAVQDRLAWPPRQHVVTRALLGQRLTTGEFTELDDVSILHCLKIWMDADDPVLAGLCRGLLFRRLYKSIDLSGMAAQDAAHVVATAAAAIAEAGGDPAYEMFYDEPTDTPYDAYHADRPAQEQILVVDPKGRAVTFDEVSPMSVALNRQLLFRRLHMAEVWRDRVISATGIGAADRT
jgi:HD superfamily phosphohydrolase